MPVDSAAIVIMGASGDLARRKLVPALASLWRAGELAQPFVVLGTGRTGFTDEQFRERFDVPPEFASSMFYHEGTRGLRQAVNARGAFRRTVVFMALPPSTYAASARELVADGFGAESSIILEKPFGYDYQSAVELNRQLTACFDESRIYRIDHYLAKEAVQNILVFRFANSLFAPIWNSRYIESIQINACERTGVEGRGAYFDGAGIIRDMVQNHLTQLLCLLTMEAPVTLGAEEIRLQKLCVLKAMQVVECRRMQYTGYRGEEHVAPDSRTETYAELKLVINNFSWTGMPVYIRTGKALHRKGTEIAVVCKALPRLLFNESGRLPANRIVFKIQPHEGIVLDLSRKEPGGELRTTATRMSFCYRDHFEGEIPEAYRRLLLDVLKGDRTLFVSAEETELSWKTYGPFLDKGELGFYEPGVLPEPRLFKDWVPFETYASACGR